MQYCGQVYRAFTPGSGIRAGFSFRTSPEITILTFASTWARERVPEETPRWSPIVGIMAVHFGPLFGTPAGTHDRPRMFERVPDEAHFRCVVGALFGTPSLLTFLQFLHNCISVYRPLGSGSGSRNGASFWMALGDPFFLNVRARVIPGAQKWHLPGHPK